MFEPSQQIGSVVPGSVNGARQQVPAAAFRGICTDDENGTNTAARWGKKRTESEFAVSSIVDAGQRVEQVARCWRIGLRRIERLRKSNITFWAAGFRFCADVGRVLS